MNISFVSMKRLRFSREPYNLYLEILEIYFDNSSELFNVYTLNLSK